MGDGQRYGRTAGASPAHAQSCCRATGVVTVDCLAVWRVDRRQSRVHTDRTMNAETATGLSQAELRDLREIAGTMIPADAALGMPGADDPAIFADIMRSIGRDLPRIREALAAITGRGFAALDQERREALLNDWYRGGGAPCVLLGRLILGAYYRDDRVLLASGLEARAPFPKGYLLEQGDWSLLDAVRRRAPFWRDDRKPAGGER